MLRAILAAVAGYVAIGVLVVFTDQLFSLMILGFNSRSTPPGYYFVLSLISDSFYSMLGGYLCATIGRAAARRATLIMILGGELIGLVAMIALWHTTPHWFALGLLILYPPSVWAGSRLRMRGEPAATSA